MPNIFFTSDDHFGQEKTCTTFMHNGAPLRPFANADEMDEELIRRWNNVVTRPDDKVYVLGDVAISKRNLETIARCNGTKRLVRGNHDIFPTKEYMKYFKEVYGCRVMTEYGIVLTHIPVHPEALNRRSWSVNVHGHTHANKMMLKKRRWYGKSYEHPDPRYLSVCVEQTDFTPLHIDEVMARIAENKKLYGVRT